MKSGSLNFLEHSGPLQVYNGTAFTIRQPRPWFLDVFPISSVSGKRFPMTSSDSTLVVTDETSFFSRSRCVAAAFFVRVPYVEIQCFVDRVS